MKTVIAVTAALLLHAIFYTQQSSADAAVCARLADTLKLPNAKVTAARAVDAGQFAVPGASVARSGGAASRAYADLPAFCRVELTLTPSPD